MNSLGAEIALEHFVADHEGVSPDTLHWFSDAAEGEGAEFLICTEKDKVKITGPLEGVLPIVWVKMRLNVVEGKKEFEAFIDKGRELLRLHS